MILKLLKGKRSILLMLMVCVVLLSACSSKEQAQPVTPTPNNTGEESQINTPETPLPTTYLNPLTGISMTQESKRRPIAVMVNNAPQARPQTGLNSADIMYEVLAEGGITRLIAIYQSADVVTKIGPVRSIRPYMIELGESYHGVLAHAGGSTDAYAILQQQKKADLDEISNAGKFFWRDKSRKAPHNLYTSLEKLIDGATYRKYDMEDQEIPTYKFQDETAEVQGDYAKQFDVQFQLKKYVVSYSYDEASRTYKRSINNAPHQDADTKEQLSATNVIVLGADHKTLDDVGRLSINLDLGGDAMLFQHGKAIKGTWIRKVDDVIRFVKDNAEVPLYPGKTHFLIVPNNPDFNSHIKIQ
jgi:hypothetical protein